MHYLVFALSLPPLAPAPTIFNPFHTSYPHQFSLSHPHQFSLSHPYQFSLSHPHQFPLQTFINLLIFILINITHHTLTNFLFHIFIKFFIHIRIISLWQTFINSLIRFTRNRYLESDPLSDGNDLLCPFDHRHVDHLPFEHRDATPLQFSHPCCSHYINSMLELLPGG